MASNRIYNGVTGNAYEFRVAGYRIGLLLTTVVAVAGLVPIALISLIGVWAILLLIPNMLFVGWLIVLVDEADPDYALPESVTILLALRGLWTRTWTSE